MKYLSYLGFRFFIFLISLLPFSLLYILSDIMRLILFNIFSYRKNVIRKNLELCFPDWPAEKTARVMKEFYKNFIDILLESVRGISMNPYKLVHRFRLKNPEILDHYAKNNIPVILFSQHFNNWEWFAICLGVQIKHHVVGIAKLIKNPYINRYLIENRVGINTSVVPTFRTGEYLSQPGLEKKAIGFFADQMPFGKERALKINFLGVETKFHLGAAYYSCKLGLPVFNMDVRRMDKRGYYEIDAVMLTEDASKMRPEELTHIYKSHLEHLIKEAPSQWLWSHKRFKDCITY